MERSSVAWKVIPLAMLNKDFFSARKYAQKYSDDPDTKVGCLITVTDGAKLLYTNRFPTQIRHSRNLNFSDKHICMVHAEQAAIADFAKHGWGLRSATMLVTHHPCLACTKAILSSGITKLIAPPPSADPIDRYNFKEAQIIIEESQIEYVEFSPFKYLNIM